MASSAVLTLDTTPPQGVTLSLDENVSSQDIIAALATTDADTTGYQAKIYGDVDDAFAPTEYRSLEVNAPWVSWTATKSIRLSTGDGLKTVRVKARDAVLNTTAEISDTTTLALVVTGRFYLRQAGGWVQLPLYQRTGGTFVEKEILDV